MLGDLFDEHCAIKASAEELLAIVRRAPRGRVDEITQLRVRISSLSMAHLRTEDERIIKPLIASGRIGEIPGAAEMIAEIRQEHRGYSRHVGKWTRQAVEADREGYARALAGLIARVRMTMAREEELLYRPAIRLLGEDQASRTG